MNVAVVIPWRGGQPAREYHHRIVREHLYSIYPDAHHLDADTGHQLFNRAASRNAGVRLAEQAGADVVILCDADTLPQPGPLAEAVSSADDGRLHLPYTYYRGLSEQGTRDHLAGGFPEECETELAHEWATGGCMVVTPNAWWQAGGMDERFIGFGHEDVAYRIAADTLLGPTVKHPGTIVHLWHPKSMGLGTPQHTANGQLCERYNHANGHPDAMRALIAERLATT